MIKLQLFNHPKFGGIEITVIDGKEFFGSTQVAKALGYSNPYDAINRHCKKDGLVKREVIDSIGRLQEMNFITEGNLYRLITHSKLPDCEEFEAWIFDDIMPTIRKHGAYMTPETIEKTLSDPDFIIGLATKLKQANEQNAVLQHKIELDKPKVLFAESLEISQDSILVADLSKLLRQNGIMMGERRLFQWMRENGYLIKSGSEYNMPSQRSMDMKLFEIRVSTRQGSDGTPRIQRTPKVTGKGQIYFLNKFKSTTQAS